MVPKSPRKMAKPGATYRPPVPPVKGLSKMNAPTPGRRTSILPNGYRPWKPLPRSKRRHGSGLFGPRYK